MVPVLSDQQEAYEETASSHVSLMVPQAAKPSPLPLPPDKPPPGGKGVGWGAFRPEVGTESPQEELISARTSKDK